MEHTLQFESANGESYDFNIDGNSVSQEAFLKGLSKIEGLEYHQTDYGAEIGYVDLTMPLEELLAQLRGN